MCWGDQSFGNHAFWLETWPMTMRGTVSTTCFSFLIGSNGAIQVSGKGLGHIWDGVHEDGFGRRLGQDRRGSSHVGNG
jgi:hypothetical protein